MSNKGSKQKQSTPQTTTGSFYYIQPMAKFYDPLTNMNRNDIVWTSVDSKTYESVKNDHTYMPYLGTNEQEVILKRIREHMKNKGTGGSSSSAPNPPIQINIPKIDLNNPYLINVNPNTFLGKTLGVTQSTTFVKSSDKKILGKLSGQDLDQTVINNWAKAYMETLETNEDDLAVVMHSYRKCKTRYSDRSEKFDRKGEQGEYRPKYEKILGLWFDDCKLKTGEYPNETVCVKYYIVTRCAPAFQMLSSFPKLRSSRTLPFFLPYLTLVELIKVDIALALQGIPDHHRPASLWNLVVEFNPKTTTMDNLKIGLAKGVIKDIASMLQLGSELERLGTLEDGISLIHIQWRETFQGAIKQTKKKTAVNFN